MYGGLSIGGCYLWDFTVFDISFVYLYLFMFSAGLEVLDAVPQPDIVLVCCGGGGLVSGVAAAIKLTGHTDTRVIAVEPEGGH